MKKYLLLEEQKRINSLLNQLENKLYQENKEELSNILKTIIKQNKDASINDITNNFLTKLTEEMIPLLNNNLTLGLQFGIKNNIFELTSYGGNYLENKEQKEINKETLFSLDSISKIMTSIITIRSLRKENYNLQTTIHELNNEYKLTETIESILKFTAQLKTEKRIENLSKEETIKLLKKCKENITKKQKNFYEYNDIGYMILRQTIPNFIEELNNLTNKNITYRNNQKNITGGRQTEENITPDKKGRDIIFPGHTGLYANIEGLLNFFYNLLYKETLLTTKEKEILWKQPYQNPILYKEDNTPIYTNKIAGIYKVPNNLTIPYDKLFLFDMPNNTTKEAIASAGTCGSWIISDNFKLNKKTKTYTSAILTNPYSFVENKEYKEQTNKLNNTKLEANSKGKIIKYSKELNPYKEKIVTYSIVLELLTEYLNLDKENTIKLTKKIKY